MEAKSRILIIDDEDIVLKSCLKILDGKDFIIETAYSGETGLSKLEKQKFDIVISDIMMPGMGGIEVLKTIVKEMPDIIVIIFTGFATIDSVREALKLGAFDYIPKPFTPDELKSVVYNAVESKKNNAETKMLDLMAIVSHDLKSPISVVHTNAETLYQGYFGDLDPRQKSTVEAIIRNCTYLEDIIRTYIDMSQMDVQALSSFKHSVDLINDIIQPVIDIPENQVNIRRMKIITDFHAHPFVYADENLIKIVVTNLINNAIKYGKNDSEIFINVEDKEDFVQFSIRNEGVGFSKEELENKLFKKYNRLKQKGTEGIKGTGLGLYICKTIIEKHGGKIWAESEEGKNAVFYFTLQKNQ